MVRHGTDRGDREITHGSAPLASALEAPIGATFTPLQFDPREFMHFVEDADLTEAEAVELLRAIWEIAVAFVDLRFGISPIQHLVDRLPRSGGTGGSGAPAVLQSSSFSNQPKPETAGREFAKVAKEDS